MAEFGAEVYSIPPDFVDRVNHYIEQDQGPDRPLIAHALSQAGGQIADHPAHSAGGATAGGPGLYPVVESALVDGPVSAAGAAGPWQFTRFHGQGARPAGGWPGGRAQGPGEIHARSCKYLRDLILDFGTGSSVMLALAAYNSGTGKVKQAVTNTVRDPIKQRNFWYLYRARALPLETREYVPKVFAAMLIGRNPHHFGF